MSTLLASCDSAPVIIESLVECWELAPGDRAFQVGNQMGDIFAKIKAALASPAWLCFVWFGMTAGVSLLATPARFSAPLITRPVALDVGAVVFAVLHKAEFIALVLLLITIRVSGRAARWWVVCAVLTLILLAQSAWLLPELTARAAMVASGIEPPPSIAHAAYSTLELLKLALLFGCGIAATTEPRRRAH